MYSDQREKAVLASKRSLTLFSLMPLLVACIPILLLIVVITQLQWDFISMFLFTVMVYFAICMKQLFNFYKEMRPKKIYIILWILLMFVTFPFGCLIFQIANWKRKHIEIKRNTHSKKSQ